MEINSLNESQILELKRKYLAELCDNGILNEKLYNEPDWDESFSTAMVTIYEYANADSIVSNEIVIEYYKDMAFSN